MDSALPPPFAAGFCLPEGQEQQGALSLGGVPGTVRLVSVGGLVLNETHFVAEQPPLPWQHRNERPVVELSFMLAGALRQSQTGLLREQLYVPGYHNWVFNPDSVEYNQLLGTGQFRLVTVQVPAARLLGLLTDYVPELPAVAEQLARGRPLVQHAPAAGLSPRLRYLLDTL